MPLGIDFSGGTLVVLSSTRPVHEDQVRKALDVLPRRQGRPEATATMPRARSWSGCPQVTDAEKGFSLGAGRQGRHRSDREGGRCREFEVVKTEVVGPVIGADLQQKGIYATLSSILGLTAYIALRFRFIFAVGAIIATFHDIFIVFTMLAASSTTSCR